MRTPPTLPCLLVEEGARRLALHHLEDATIARRRVTGCPDPEALHDYRVALRRLRSCLRAYREQLRSTVSRRSYRRLRRLARGTSQSRDLEVHLAWVGEQLKQVGDAERAGVGWMMDRLRTTKSRAREEMLALEQKLFPRLRGRLGSQLASLRTTIPDRFDLRPRTTAAVTAVKVRRASERLRTRLSRIRSYAAEVEIHRARIAAKHLRYLLEPFAAGLPDGGAVVQRLKALQDSFGDVHDAQVFEKELLEARPQTQTSDGPALVPGIDALLAALRARGRHAFDSASPAWLGPGAEPFFRQVEALAGALPGLGHYPEEVERKFLLTGLPPLAGAEGPEEIEQGYLPGQRLVERLRRIQSDEGVELVRTVKEGSGLARLEVEEAVTPDGFAQLWPLTQGRRLRKRRYRIADGDLTWEIDQFLDRELVLAEVEFTGESVDLRIPGWLVPYVDREVTEESAYSNVNLASTGSRHEV